MLNFSDIKVKDKNIKSKELYDILVAIALAIPNSCYEMVWQHLGAVSLILSALTDSGAISEEDADRLTDALVNISDKRLGEIYE